MAQLYKLFIVIIFVGGFNIQLVYGQSTANYTFASATNGSLTDMSSGTTQIIAENITNGLSTLQNIGFDFYYMGMKYTQFGVSSNGVFRFGALPSNTATNSLTSTASGLQNILAPFWDALATSSTGGVRYKVTGSAPNRILTVEWFNMKITTASSTTDATFQGRIYETTGKIEFAYGSMNIGTGSGTVTASIGFKTAQANNSVLSVTSITTPAITTTAASVNNNLVNSSVAGPIAGLNSSNDGSRVIYSFTPPAAPNAPTNLTFTPVTNISMTLNWTDNATNEIWFAIERSTDGGSTYAAVTLVAPNVISYNGTGLSPGVTYFWRVYAVREGSASSSLDGSQATTAIVPNPPTNLTFTNIGAGSITLNWVDNSADEINFKVEQSTDGGSTYSQIALLSSNTVTYSAKALSLSTIYYWRIYAIGAGNLSSAALQGSQSTIAGAITGIKTVGLTGDYFAIQDAFDAINTQGLGGSVVLELQSDYNPAFDPATINCYGNTSGSSSSANVTLRPASGVAGLVFTSSQINFNFNGTKYFTIDGRPGGAGTAQEITISNTSTSGNAIQFINDASNNTIRYCKISGVNTSGSSGVILQSTTTGIMGNDYNTIDNCEIRDGASAPANLIYNAGTSGKSNDGFTLSNCRLFNFSRSGFTSSATGTGSNYTFTGNSFYQSSTPPSAVTSALTIRGIDLQGAGDSHLISGSYFGGQDVNCGGSAFLNTGATTQFTAISITASNNIASVIQNNVIQNINMTGTGSAFFYGIFANGTVNITGNLVGHNSIANSILYAGNNLLYNILCTSSPAINCTNNTVANSTSSSTAPNIGIDITSPNLLITNNTVHNLSSQGGVRAFNVSSFSGNANISANVIYSLKSLSLTSSFLSGIYCISATGTISRNRMYDLSNTSSGNIYGIYSTTSPGSTAINYTIVNNQIAIQNNPNTNDVTVNGISAPGGKVYYNSVYLGGSVSSGTKTSSGIYKDTNTVFLSTGLDARNNIIYNERTGGTGNHYALDYTNNNTSITSDYNLLIGAASTIGRWGTTAYNFADYKTASSKDSYSLSNQPMNVGVNNLFTDKSVGNMNILSANNEAFYSNGKGIPIAGQLDDYSLTNVRDTSIIQGTTDIGSDEFDYSGTVPNLTESAPPALNTTTTYSFGGRQVASIFWGNTGTVPSSFTVAYNQGVDPPLPLTGQYSNGFWDFTATGGTGFTYDITLNYSPAILFNIADETHIKLAKRDNGVWDYLSGSTVNITNKTVTATGLTGFSQFAITSSDAPLPVELSSFSSLAIKNEVVLDWSTVLEINNSGFDIEKKPVSSNDWQKISFVYGKGNSSVRNDYKYNDKNLQTGKYNYRLKQIDYNGNYHYYNLQNEVEVGVPSKYNLSQNYPNPFNPTTKINYELPNDVFVSLKIYDLTGRQMNELVNQNQQAGYYTINFNAMNLSSGIYFYSFRAGDFVSTKRMMLVK